MQVTSWQPIETAPKDGTHVLLAFERPLKPWRGAKVVSGPWCAETRSWLGTPYTNTNQPIAWMPLPDPPKETVR